MFTETLIWYPIAEKLPDDDVTVLVKVLDGGGETVWPGYHVDGGWLWADGGAPDSPVLAWASMPAGWPDPVKALGPIGVNTEALEMARELEAMRDEIYAATGIRPEDWWHTAEARAIL